MQPLKLTALDAEDLAVLSAHMQDAVLGAEDIAWLPGRGRLALVANRFDWEGARKRARRRRAGLRFDRVMRVTRQNFEPGAKGTVLSLLAILFHPGEAAPSGTIELVFSGGAGLKAEVECIEASLEDLGPVWETRRVPSHSQG